MGEVANGGGGNAPPCHYRAVTVGPHWPRERWYRRAGGFFMRASQVTPLPESSRGALAQCERSPRRLGWRRHDLLAETFLRGRGSDRRFGSRLAGGQRFEMFPGRGRGDVFEHLDRPDGPQRLG